MKELSGVHNRAANEIKNIKPATHPGDLTAVSHTVAFLRLTH